MKTREAQGSEAAA